MVCTTGSKSLWEFALALYSSPGVEETALYLQDTHGANVNILLWAAWLEARSVPLSQGLLQGAESAIVDWDREVVRVLRDLRRRLKGEEAALVKELRSSVKAAELLSERQCLSLLEALAMPPAAANFCPGQNLDVYMRRLNAVADLEVIRQALAHSSRDDQFPGTEASRGG